MDRADYYKYKRCLMYVENYHISNSQDKNENVEKVSKSNLFETVTSKLFIVKRIRNK